MGQGLGSGPRQRGKRPWGQGLGRVSVGQILYLGPAWKQRGSISKGLPPERGVPEFGGKALGEGVWVGFSLSAVGGGLRGGLQV